MCYLIKINLRKAILTPKVLKSLFQNIRFTGCDILSKSILRKAILTPEGSNVYRINNSNHVSDPRRGRMSIVWEKYAFELFWF
jgi:hypothetical protein